MVWNMTMNYSANSITGMNTLTSWFPILAVVLALSVLLGIVLTAVSFWWFRKVLDVIDRFTGSIRYALYGSVVLGSFGVASFGIWEFLMWNTESNIPLWYYPLGIVGYVFLYSVGRISEGVYQRLKRNYNKATKLKKHEVTK